MFILPFSKNTLFRNTSNISYLRLLHASPNAPKVDIYLNDKLFVKNLKYRNFSKYFPVVPGFYRIKIYPSSNKKTSMAQNPVIETNLFIENNQILTGAIIGTLNSLFFKPIEDPIIPTTNDNPMIRFIHVSPNTSSVNTSLTNSDVIFTNTSFSEVTEYESLLSAVYSIQIRDSKTDKILLLAPNMRLKKDNFYSIYFIGFSNNNPPLQVLVPLDGNSYIKF